MSSFANYTELEKKSVVNRLPVPMFILSLINDYLFHNKMTSPVMQKIRQVKNEICDLIENHSLREQGYDNPEEDWFFTLSISSSTISSLARIVVDPNIGIFDNLDDYWPLSIEYEFSGRNCKVCGEYKQHKQDIYAYNSGMTRGLTYQNTCKCEK